MKSTLFPAWYKAITHLLGLAALSIPSFESTGSANAGTVTFGSGAHQFNMEFVTIGNPGNAADTTGTPNPAGSVGYEYGIGKFEVSEDMINKYNSLNPTHQINTGTQGGNKPAYGVSWYEAALFVNWLNTSTGHQAAYRFLYDDPLSPRTYSEDNTVLLWNNGEAGYDASNPVRNSLAKYFLPNYNEWYKAAYYDPSTSTYYDYATGSNTAPTAVASGISAGTAVYDQWFGADPADVDQAGGLSPYGVMGLGGNVLEWEESSFDLADSGSHWRGLRGGNWFTESSYAIELSSLHRVAAPFNDWFNLGHGFRVASAPTVPEPSMMVIGTLLGLGGLMAGRRMKR